MSIQEQAMKLARGSYQRNLILGRETLGGSTLRGKAKTYSGRYGQSASNLISRLKENKIAFNINFGPRGGWWSAVLDFPMTYENWSRDSFGGQLWPCDGIFEAQYQRYLKGFSNG